MGTLVQLNEPHLALETAVHEEVSLEKRERKRFRHVTKVKTTSKSNNSLSLLIQFLATSWKLNPKELFEAEFGCFVALEFKTHASPSQVAFHFRRLMRSLEKDPARYLGNEMWAQWQEAIKYDGLRANRREARRRKKKQKSERKILKLERKLTLKSKIEKERREKEKRRREELDSVMEEEEFDSVSETDSRRRKPSAARMNFLQKLFKKGPAPTTSASVVSSKTSNSGNPNTDIDIEVDEMERSTNLEDPHHHEAEEDEV